MKKSIINDFQLRIFDFFNFLKGPFGNGRILVDKISNLYSIIIIFYFYIFIILIFSTTTLYNSNFFSSMENLISSIKDKNTDLSDTYGFTGFLYIQAHNNKSALADFNKFISIDANNVNSLHNRGYIKLNTEDLNGSILDFNRAVRHDPTNQNIIYNRALVLKSLGQLDESLNSLNKLIKMGAISPKIYTDLGIVKQMKK